ncbi:MAG: helix-turn-helix transcriptional regulator [Phenylobacterium sp.]|uniref:helix-turn-helix transcriptional regulator n=1 Tax=Phenylobacterium sp. TaxID=1871053 RepID=UPI001A406588|nr:helix-turn-helix transcriptional regulator [Phenylobacterium sp.]MBL8770300.1 helix-turn-helix transcriptional regulator [Phenylobacterium sp.]
MFDEARLIDDIYAAALDPARWVGVMERLSDAVGGLRGCLTRIDTRTGQGVDAILFRSDPAWVDAYARHFGTVNVFMGKGGEAAPTVSTELDCLAREDYLRSEYYNDFMRPQDVDRALFIRLGATGTVASTINIGRRTGQTFDNADLELAARLRPHMVRAFEIGQRLAGSAGMTRTLVDALQVSSHAMFLVAPDGALGYANAAGERLLARGRGLTVLNGRLTTSHAESARRLEQLLADAAFRAGPRAAGAMNVPSPAGGMPLALRTTPMPLDDGPVFRAAAPVLVSVTDLEDEVRAPEDELRLLFGLTPAEARLAAAVFDGLTLAEAAERFGVSVNTTRFQLARVFDKTGVTRQAELVKLMMRLASGPPGV